MKIRQAEFERVSFSKEIVPVVCVCVCVCECGWVGTCVCVCLFEGYTYSIRVGDGWSIKYSLTLLEQN